MEIVPGSLNVELDTPFDWNAPSLIPFKRVHSLTPFGGNRDICLIPCEVYTEESIKIYGFAWATTYAASDINNRVLEIITSVKLRDVLKLENGSIVQFDIPVSWN